jgi:hypothetical protein
MAVVAAAGRRKAFEANGQRKWCRYGLWVILALRDASMRRDMPENDANWAENRPNWVNVANGHRAEAYTCTQ